MADLPRQTPEIVFPPCPPGFEQNTGSQPRKSRRKRVMVMLMNGNYGKSDPGTTTANGWDADKCDWTISAYSFAIAHSKVL